MEIPTEQQAAAVDGIAKAISLGSTIIGQPVASELATTIGALLVDGITNGTLSRLVAHAQATAAVINSEAAAELAARSRT